MYGMDLMVLFRWISVYLEDWMKLEVGEKVEMLLKKGPGGSTMPVVDLILIGASAATGQSLFQRLGRSSIPQWSFGSSNPMLGEEQATSLTARAA